MVVVILGILGALVYPHFANARADAADKAARTQLQGLRSQIEMYKIQHGGAVPDLVTSWNPLINATVYNNKTVGPYIPRAPKNGLNNLSNVVDGDGTGPVGSPAGFVYDYAGGEKSRFNFTAAWPSKVSIASMQAGGNDVLVEECTITHEGIAPA